MNFLRKAPVATVAFNLRPRSGPYGGGNQWASQLGVYLRRCGYRVVYSLDKKVDLVMGTFAGLNGPLTFSYADVLDLKGANPRLRCIQRINDNDARKSVGGMDAYLAASAPSADHTVFVSRWLRDYHSQRWFDAARPHSVIPNGADPSVFHPFGNRPWTADTTFRIATHHWSDNAAKGFGLYAELDRLISAGVLPGVELHVIGRWPAGISWQAARLHGPCSGDVLARKLRACNAAITASRCEPGAMHPVEALQCGLPLLYTGDTGGTVELGEKFGVLIEDDIALAIRLLQCRHQELRSRVIGEFEGGDAMCASYRRLIQSVLNSRF